MSYLDENLNGHDLGCTDGMTNFFDHFFIHDMKLERHLPIVDYAVTADYIVKNKTIKIVNQGGEKNILRLGLDATI